MTPVGGSCRVWPWRWNARLWLPGRRRVEVAERVCWPALGPEPLVEFSIHLGERALWGAEAPALVVAAAATAEELAGLVRRALRDEVSAVLLAPPGVPPTLDPEARERRGLVRVLAREAGEPLSKVLERAGGAVEALVRARLYRQLRQRWLERAAACAALLAAVDALPYAPRRDVVERAPLRTATWAHANEVAGLLFPAGKVAEQLVVVPETARRLRSELPEALQAATGSAIALSELQDVDAVRRALQRAEDVIAGLEGDLRALQLGPLGDRAVSHEALEAAAKAEALAITGSKCRAALRLGIDRKGLANPRRAAPLRA